MAAQDDRALQSWRSETRALAAVVGRTAPSKRAEGLYAADLGWTFKHEDRLWVLFGDSWSSEINTTIDPSAGQDADDALGHISLTEFPDGDSVDAFIRSHPAAEGALPWQATPPTLSLTLDPTRNVVTPIRQVRDGQALSSGPGLTPLTGFSNARSGDASGAFGVFLRNAQVECVAGACASGWDCDTGLGICLAAGATERADLSMPCVLGSEPTNACSECRPLAGGGFCQDRGSSMYAADNPRGRTAAVPTRLEVGNALRDSEVTFATSSWDTHRFFNTTARTVRDFAASRPHGAGNDYRTADGQNPDRDGVFLWGRPHFGGIGADHRDAQLYLAWVPMPDYEQTGKIGWRPQYFAGLDRDGRPRFVEREADSVPLDLDAALSGDQPDEIIDTIGQMSVSWLPSLERWVMLYGGALGDRFLELIFGSDRSLIRAETVGPIYSRYAQHPWGPWSAPQPLLEPGDPSIPSGEYAPGGILFSGQCQGTQCAPGELIVLGEAGRLYGVDIIEPWTEESSEAVRLYWHVSTWNPYQVLLMNTILRAP